VSRLQQAWTFKLTGKAAAGAGPYGSLAAKGAWRAGIRARQRIPALSHWAGWGSVGGFWSQFGRKNDKTPEHCGAAA
jgi:hypothetical protein